MALGAKSRTKKLPEKKSGCSYEKRKMAALVPAAWYVGARAVFQSKRLAELVERAHVAAKSDAERAVYARLRRAYDAS